MSIKVNVEAISLDTVVKDFTRTSLTQPAFGIEIELEGCKLRHGDEGGFSTSGYWLVKRETSLRGHGAEFITNGPMVFKNLELITLDFPKALKELASTTPECTIRCSTHIHINVAYLTLRQVFTAACLYYLFENALVRTQSQFRQGNLFCLRMVDASHIVTMLCDGVKRPAEFHRTFSQNSAKYSALNLATVHRLGTMEFRFLSPIIEPKLLAFWVRIFQAIIDYAQKNTATELIADYDALSLKEFMSKIWGKDASELYDKFITNATPGALTKQIHRNYDNVVEVTKRLNKKKFELAPIYWDPDNENMPDSLYYEPDVDQALVTLDDIEPDGAPQGWTGPATGGL